MAADLRAEASAISDFGGIFAENIAEIEPFSPMRSPGTFAPGASFLDADSRRLSTCHKSLSVVDVLGGSADSAKIAEKSAEIGASGET